MSPHVVRHTFATTDLQKRLSLPTVQKILVHERGDQAPPVAVTTEEVRRRINTLLPCLPVQW